MRKLKLIAFSISILVGIFVGIIIGNSIEKINIYALIGILFCLLWLAFLLKGREIFKKWNKT